MIAVGTPQGEDGSADLQYVIRVAEEIGMAMDRELVVVTKSTVPVGTQKSGSGHQVTVGKRGGNSIRCGIQS